MGAKRTVAAPWGALVMVLGCTAVDPFVGEEELVAPAVGAVVSEHPLATKAGLIVLEAGGNAADAAVATALALAVVYPQAGNLGGGGFALWAPSGGAPESIDFREVAPAGYTPDLYLGPDGEVVRSRSIATPLAVGIPGSPKGLFELYSTHGSKRLSFAQLCESAISLAEGGFTVGPWLAAQLVKPDIRLLLTADPGAAALFYPAGKPLTVGDRLIQRNLGRTLRLYAARGPLGFYHGEVAAAIVEDLEDADERAGRVAGSALLSREDLRSYGVRWRKPLVSAFRGSRVIALGPPSSGGVAVAQVLGMLEGLPVDAERKEALNRMELGLDPVPQLAQLGNVVGAGELGSASSPRVDSSGLSARAVHWWIEAMRRAFADRAMHLGDSDHYPVPMENLLDPGWIAARCVSIGERADLGVGAWAPTVADGSGETTHLSVIDRDGNAVSLTTTLNGSFGSGIYVDKAGFLLNNELDDFSIQAGVPNMYGLVGSAANQLAPGKRPLSSMCPLIVRDERGRVSMVLGSPGGPRIITSVLQVLLRVLVYDQDLVTAIRAPRIHQQWRPMETRLEAGFDPQLVDDLVERHDQPILPPEPAIFGSVQGILVGPDGSVTAYSDPRRGGSGGLEGGEVARPADLPLRD